MKNKNRFPISVILMFAIAIGLLGFSTVGGARAVLTSFSDEYDSEFTMNNIGITLNEHPNYGDGTPVAHRNYGSGTDGKWDGTGEKEVALLDWYKDEVKVGSGIKEGLSITNTGSIDEYVRLVLYVSWWQKDDSGNLVKMTDLDPSLIKVEVENDVNWKTDTKYSTDERTILYYTQLLPGKADGKVYSTEQVKLNIFIDPKVKEYIRSETVEKRGNVTVITTEFAYDGATIKVEAEAHGVQGHNAVDAIKSAWGRDVKVENDILSLS